MDRLGLQNTIERYLGAISKNDVNGDLFSPDCLHIENGVRLPLGGEGLWNGTSERSAYEFYIPDIDPQQVANIGTVKEKDSQVGIALRLKTRDQLITEIEQIAIRSNNEMATVGLRHSVEYAVPIPHSTWTKTIVFLNI